VEISVSEHTLAVGCIYTGPDMKSHFKEMRLPYGNAAASGITFWTDMLPASGWRAALLQPGRRDWHANPNPAISILLSGRVETTLGDGVRRTSTVGGLGLSLDALGQGHLTEVIGSEPAHALAMLLSRDQLTQLSKILIGWPTDIVLPPAN
jgi:hypothetical protein